MEREERKIKITFFKQSGKYYSSGLATVKHFQFEDEYKQDIVNTQDTLMDGWQEGEFFVVTTEHDNRPENRNFDENLYWPGAFQGLKREES